MAHERANPSGYVDKRYLYDEGARVQDADATLADLRKKYTALVHKPFNDASCPKPAP
jgi:hypothetical protein